MKREFLEISDVKFKSGVPPIIVHFENGDLPYTPNSMPECGIYRDNEAPEKYVAGVCTKDGLLYQGLEPNRGAHRTVLAIQDHGSKKVRLVEVDNVLLKPKPCSSNLQLSAITPATDTAAYSELYKEFGSKQVRRRTEQRERMSFKVDSFSSRLDETFAEINVDNSLTVMENINYYGTYVKCNQNAKVPSEVYQLSDIISMTELNELHDEAVAVIENTAEENAADYSEFFNTNFLELPTDNHVFRTQVLMYAECILQFLSLKGNDLNRKNVSQISSVIGDKLLNSFSDRTVGKARERPESLKNKAVSHAIVAGLIACNFTLHVGSIPAMVSMHADKLVKLYRSLGLRMSEKGDNTKITLKVPLPKPPKFGGRRKRM